ncbi:MAG: SDR family NAD(P)-dependent oxidoreductase [Halioglobus sp.]
MKRFDSSAVLVTGGASGIGKAVAHRLAEEGADIVIGDINLEPAQAVAAAISEQHGVAAQAVAVDVADTDSCKNLVETAVATLGKLDVLVNCAGIMEWFRTSEYPEENFERVMQINLFSVFYLSKHALPHLLASRGNVVSISSAASLGGVPYAAAYCTSKGGINAMTRAMAVEYAEEGVRFNAICPGAVDTPMNTPESLPLWGDMNKVARLSPKTGVASQPEEIAAAVAYLASPDACNITGTMLSVDGGQMAG